MNMKITYEPKFLRIMSGCTDHLENFINIAIIPDHIIKVILVLNGSGHVTGFMFVCQFRFRLGRVPIFPIPLEASIPLNNIDSLETDISRGKSYFNKSPNTVFPLGILKSAVLAERP